MALIPSIIPGLAASPQDLLYDVALHVSQPEMPALELERQPGVVDSQAVQNGRVQVACTGSRVML